MSNLKELTDTLVKNYLRYDSGEFFLIYDNDTKQIGESILSSLSKFDQKNIHDTNLDDYRNGKPLTEFPSDVLSEIKSSFKPENINTNKLLYIMAKRIDEPAFGRTLIDLIINKENPLGAVAGLPGCTMDVLEAGYSKENNPEFVKELYEFLQQEKEIIVTNELGTNLVINIDTNKYNWVASDGIVQPKKYRNPIPAEVYTYPANVNGKFVITGSYAYFMSLERYKGKFGQLVEDLRKTPLTWEIKDGKIIDVFCDDPELKAEAMVEIYTKDKEHGMKIGEIGIPANLYVLKRKLTGQLLIDEKGRVHMANGDGYADMTNCEYKSNVHSDGLAERVTLYSPRLGKNFMENDMYNPDIFSTLRKH
jgi:hypothetical protein